MKEHIPDAPPEPKPTWKNRLLAYVLLAGAFIGVWVFVIIWWVLMNYTDDGDPYTP